ncbi:MAG: hypothetical protein KY455_00510 [Euryarchaeota archaeon]|nr:hypothetical protein [Euryarchaeota archaeon]
MLTVPLRPLLVILTTGLIAGPAVPLVAVPFMAGDASAAPEMVLAPPPVAPAAFNYYDSREGPTLWSYAFIVSADNDLAGTLRIKGVTVQGDDLSTKVRWTQSFILAGDAMIGGAGGGAVADPSLLHIQKDDTHVATPGYGGLMGNLGASQVPFSARNHSGVVQLVVFSTHDTVDIRLESEWTRGVMRHGATEGDPSDILMRTLTDLHGGDHHGVQVLGSEGKDLAMSFSTHDGLVGWFFGSRPGHRIDWTCTAPPGSQGCGHGDGHAHDHPLVRLVTRTPGPWRFDVHTMEDDHKQDPLLVIAARLPPLDDHAWQSGTPS